MTRRQAANHDDDNNNNNKKVVIVVVTITATATPPQGAIVQVLGVGEARHPMLVVTAPESNAGDD
jgi:hypothetical protein